MPTAPPWEGGCLCGQVRVKVSAPPLLTMACHCTGCQRMRTTMLDDPRPFPPFVETFTREKLAWAQTPAAHAYPEFPPAEAFEGLMRDYAAQGLG
jgi:hypothetical protein